MAAALHKMVRLNDTADEVDWQHGTWQRAGSGQAAATVAITSDWAPIRRYSDAIARQPEAVYGDLAELLRRADLRITNLECPLTQRDTPVWKSGSELKGAPEHLGGLTTIPFEAVTLANNHVFDHGVEAFGETTRRLDDHRIQWVGAGMTAEQAHRPLIVEIKGVRLGIVNFSEGEDLTAAGSGPGVFGWELDRAAGIVGDLKKKGCVVLVICHCGVEYIPFPPPYVVEAFQYMVDAGADLVIGHHPHVPQGVQLYRGVPICYSLGNFVFYQETDLLYRKVGYCVEAGLSPTGVNGISLVPYEIGPHGLALLSENRRRQFFEALKAVSSPLASAEMINAAWHGFLRRYGLAGFKAEIDMLMERLAVDPFKGAAMFRNRVTTLQHRHHWIDALTRIIDGTIDEAPGWAMELIDTWLTQKR